MRISLSIVLCVLIISELRAQSVPNVEIYSREDTVRAIQHLFKARRKGGDNYIGIGVPLTLVGALSTWLSSVLITTIQLGQGKEKTLPLTLVGGSVGLVPTGIGLLKQNRFRRQRELAVITSYQAGEPLPRRIRRKLKAKFFR